MKKALSGNGRTENSVSYLWAKQDEHFYRIKGQSENKVGTKEEAVANFTRGKSFSTVYTINKEFMVLDFYVDFFLAFFFSC